VNPEALAMPVGASMRSTEMLHAEDSLARAGALLRHTAYPFVPIVHEGALLGAVSEASFAAALAEGESLVNPCLRALMVPPTISPRASGAEALRRLVDDPHSALLVVDDEQRVYGVISASDLTDDNHRAPTPHQIGGMPTPFGVYLTTGSVSGGVPQWALISVGAMLFTIFVLTDQLSVSLADSLGDPVLSGYAITWLPVILFLATIRLLPLSGTHAAEHMVVHAIERGEELRPEIVKRMPRVHPRCGTNLAVGASIFLGLFNWEWVADQEIRLLVALLATFILYRPLGSMVQLLITTRPPNDRQIESGIRAGKELLARYRTAHGPQPTPFTRILHSGLPDAETHIVHIGATGIAEIGDVVHERDAESEHGVGGIFGDLCRARVHHQNRIAREHKRMIEFTQNFFGAPA